MIYRLKVVSSNICYYITDRLENAPKKIPCHINKVTTGAHVNAPPFCFIRKPIIFVVTYILLHIRKMDYMYMAAAT